MSASMSNVQGLHRGGGGGGGVKGYWRFNLTTTLVPYLVPNAVVPVWVQENCSCREKCDVCGFGGPRQVFLIYRFSQGQK